MKGVLYGVGVGPGDPELLTLKAVKILNGADVIACPAKGEVPGLAYRIAEQACPQISLKEKLVLRFPMQRGDQIKAHQEAADTILHHLQAGKKVAFLTLGDPGFYSTFFYAAEHIGKQGFQIEIVNGIPSFCAALAKLKIPAASGDKPVLITTEEYSDFDGTQVILKAGSSLQMLKEKIQSSGKRAYMVENCGMSDERVYDDIQSMPDVAGYFTLLFVI